MRAWWALQSSTLGGAYFVGGSVASSLYGDPRLTNDIDFVVSLPLGRLRAFVDALGSDFELDEEMFREAMLRGSCANGFYLPVLTKIDLFALGNEAFDQIEFERRLTVSVGAEGETLVVKTAEDSVLRKLLWFREGGEVSTKQWNDVLAILRAGGSSLDHAHMATWAPRIGCRGLLRRALDEAAAQ